MNEARSLEETKRQFAAVRSQADREIERHHRLMAAARKAERAIRLQRIRSRKAAE